MNYTNEQITDMAIDLFPLIEHDDSYGDYVQASKRHGFEIGFQKCQELNQNGWVSVGDRLPSLKEQRNPDNWKFLVCNINDEWSDAAYFINSKWNNGECDIKPTHWMPLPKWPLI